MGSTFSLDLSFGELRWLAGAFSMASLPFSLPAATLNALDDAQKSLQKRGVIQQGQPYGWQVEPFAALCLQWMGNSPRYWFFEQFQRNGGTLEAVLFLQDGAALLVLPFKDGKRLIMCKDMDSAIEEWQLAVDFPTLNGAEILPKWDVPQPITVIRTSWKNLPLAKSMADAKFVAWATDLDWSGEWTLVMQGIRLSRLVLAVQGRSVWLGKYSPEQPGEFLLKTFHQTVLMEVMKANI